jgi:hypothetical protein
MALARRIGLGITIGIDRTGSNNFTTLGYLVGGLKRGTGKAQVIECPIATDTYIPKGKGQITPGQTKFKIYYDPSDSSNTNNSRLLAAALADTGPPGTEANFKVTYPAVGAVNALSETFKGWVTDLGDLDLDVKSPTVADVTVDISGDPGLQT